MKNKSNRAFSIIEVVVSSIILSLSVFWIYKLIAENNRIIDNSNNYLDANLLINNMISCIDNIWFDSLKASSFATSTGSFYFENSLTWKCLTWNYNSDYSFSWVKLNNLDYYLYWRIITSWTDSLIWKLCVYNDSVWKIEKDYTMWR
jgi:hypothetical protein